MMTIPHVLLFVIISLLSLGGATPETRQAHAQGLHSSQNSDLEHLFFLAGKGNIEAQFRIGLIYDLGQETPQDYVQARQWYEKAASGGLADADYLLGGMYELGHGVPLNLKKAVDYYEKAASKGQADAQLDLANIFFYGAEGIPKNYSRAAEWYEAAAQQGIVEAQRKIAMMYEGIGLPKDYKKAKNWYEKAASQGDISAKASLGLLYSEGKGVERNFSKALEYLKPAANAGNWSAQFTLGTMYADGRGVPQDYVEAHKWFNILAAVGFEQVVEARNRLTKKMTPVQIAEAQRLASEFEKQHQLPNSIRKVAPDETIVLDPVHSSTTQSNLKELPPDAVVIPIEQPQSDDWGKKISIENIIFAIAIIAYFIFRKKLKLLSLFQRGLDKFHWRDREKNSFYTALSVLLIVISGIVWVSFGFKVIFITVMALLALMFWGVALYLLVEAHGWGAVAIGIIIILFLGLSFGNNQSDDEKCDRSYDLRGQYCE